MSFNGFLGSDVLEELASEANQKVPDQRCKITGKQSQTHRLLRSLSWRVCETQLRRVAVGRRGAGLAVVEATEVEVEESWGAVVMEEVVAVEAVERVLVDEVEEDREDDLDRFLVTHGRKEAGSSAPSS